MTSIAVPISSISAPMTYAAIAKSVFGGEILLFEGGGGAELLRAARALCRDVFAATSPTAAHRLYGKEEFFRRADEAQRRFNSREHKALFADWLRAIGVNAGELYWDALGLRIAPPVATHAGGWRSSIGAHRDTWGTGVQSQINWWSPLWPLSDGRTMAFYPQYWRRPLANSTAEWSFEEYLAARKKTPPGREVAYPSAPRALAQPTTPPAMTRMQCGEMLAFSAAHLHASVLNKTDLTRFSLEIRTLSPRHVRDNRGAPNVDCASAPPLLRLFRGVAKDDKLADAL